MTMPPLASGGRAAIGRGAAHLCAAALALLVARPDAPHAQPAGVTGRPIVCAELPERGPDPQRLGLARALAAAEAYRLDVDALSYTLAWAEREADPAHIPVLKQIVEAYRCGVGNAALALLAIGAAGEPADYFLGYVANATRDDALASYAIGALEARNDPSVFPALETIIDNLPGERHERGPRGFQVAAALYNFYSTATTDSLWQAGPLSQYLDYLAGFVAGEITSGRVRDGRVVVGESDPWGYASGGSGRDRQALRRLARSHPTAVRAAIERGVESAARFERTENGRTATELTDLRRAAAERATATAFPPTAARVSAPRSIPPVTLKACLGDLPEHLRAQGAAAEFTYEATATAPFRIPYGAANALRDGAGGSLDGSQPEVFFPDDERRFRTFRVTLPAGGSVSWTLAGQTATVDATTLRCSE